MRYYYFLWFLFIVSLFLIFSSFQKTNLKFNDIAKKGQKYENENYDLAIKYYQTFLRDSEEKFENKSKKALHNYTFASISLAQCYVDRIEYENALNILDAALGLINNQKLKDSILYTNLILQKAYTLIDSRALDKGFTLLRQIERNLEKHQSSYIKAKLLYCQGKYYYKIGRREISIAYYKKALQFLKKNPSKERLVSNILVDLGFAYYGKNLDSARICFNQVKNLNKLPDGWNYSLIWAHFQLGIIAEKKGDNNAFLYNYLRVKEIHDKIKVWPENHPYVININNNLSVAYKNAGDYDNAILYIDRSISALERKNPQMHASDKRMNKANIIKDIKRYKEAEKMYNEILPYLIQNQDSFNIYSTYNNLGIVYQALKNYKKSEQSHQKSLQLKIEHVGPIHEYVGKSHIGLGDLYLETGNLEAAENNIRKAKEIFLKIGQNQGANIASAYYLFSKFYTLKKDNISAINWLQKAINALVLAYPIDSIFIQPDLKSEIKSKIDLLPVLATKATVLSKLYSASQKMEYFEGASETYSIASTLIDTIRRSYSSEGSKQTLMEEARNVYEGAINHTLSYAIKYNDENYFEEAFNYLEKSKYVLLNEAIASNRTKFKAIPDSLLKEEKRLSDKIGNLELEQSKLPEENERFQTLINEKFKLEQRKDSLNGVLKTNYPIDYERQYIQTVSIKEVQAYLKQKPKTALIEYALSENTLFSYVVTADTFYAYQQKLDSIFFNALDSVLFTIDSLHSKDTRGEIWAKQFDSFVKNSSNIYHTLLKKQLHNIEEKNLIIIPDRELGYLPFQVLLNKEPVEEATKEKAYHVLPYLFKEYNLYYEYSATLLLNASPKREKPETIYTGYAPIYSNYDELLDSLEFNIPSVIKIEELLGGLGLTKELATKESFKEMAPQTRILHLSTHGEINNRNPQYSWLAFSIPQNADVKDGRLYAYELYNIPLSADLAVLSACNTGSGKLQRGEGIMSLARTFKYAGCNNIIMSLWSANDNSTKAIMEKFFKKLRAGNRKDVALKKAKLDFFYEASKSPDLHQTHPFYWAPFVLIGDETPIEFSIGMPLPIIIGLGLLVVLLVFLIVRRNSN